MLSIIFSPLSVQFGIEKCISKQRVKRFFKYQSKLSQGFQNFLPPATSQVFFLGWECIESHPNLFWFPWNAVFQKIYSSSPKKISIYPFLSPSRGQLSSVLPCPTSAPKAPPWHSSTPGTKAKIWREVKPAILDGGGRSYDSLKRERPGTQ